MKMKMKKAFTFIELVMVVSIIAILVSAVYASIGSARKKAKINATKVSLKTTLPAIIYCKDDRGNVPAPPIAAEYTGKQLICNPSSRGLAKAYWPVLLDYAYTDTYNFSNSEDCYFEVKPMDGSELTDILTCDCKTQRCN